MDIQGISEIQNETAQTDLIDPKQYQIIDDH
jgi:hypothetical protein